jgi:ABC-2 type transport system permease protein
MVIFALLPILIASTAVQFANDGNGLTNFEAQRFLQGIYSGFLLPILFPLMTLFLAAMVIREEIQNNTITYLWVKPISRASIVLTKFVSAFIVSFSLIAVSIFITTFIAIPDLSLALNLVLATGIGMLAYGALFLAASLVFSRAILIGMAYIIVWEGSFSRISTLTSDLSIRHYASNFAANIVDLSRMNSTISLESSLIVLLTITVGLLVVAVYRFSSMEFSGSNEE